MAMLLGFFGLIVGLAAFGVAALGAGYDSRDAIADTAVGTGKGSAGTAWW